MELLRHRSASFRCPIDDNWNEKGPLVGHITGAVRCQTPLAAEIAFIAAFRICRDHRDEQTAVVDLLSDLAIPGVPAPQLALIEPDFDARGA